MEIAFSLFCMCAILAILGIHRAILNRSQEQNKLAKENAAIQPASLPQTVVPNSIDLTNVRKLKRHISAKPYSAKDAGKAVLFAVTGMGFAANSLIAQGQLVTNFIMPASSASTEVSKKSAPVARGDGFSNSTRLAGLPAEPVADLRFSAGGVASFAQDKNQGSFADRWHHADGLRKLTFAFGGGLNVPTGSTSNRFALSYGLQGGVGYNFNKKLGAMANVGYDHLGLRGSVIQSQQVYYQTQNIIDPTTGAPADFSGLDANAHLWSVTLDPFYTFYQGNRIGAYAIGGGGFFHKAVNFTLPQSSYYCDPYYGFCYPITQNANFDTHTANGGGFDGGFGVTYSPSGSGSIKLFTEIRYVWSDAKLTPRTTNPSPISVLDKGSDSYIPITLGFRW